MLVLSALTGVLCGYAAIGFYIAIQILTKSLFDADEATLASGARTLEWWHIIAVPLGAGVIVGQFLRFLPNQRSSSVPEVIEAAALRAGKLPLKEGLLSAAVTITSLGGGASTGREGPVVHLGATLASLLTTTLNLPPRFGRTLLGCGVAAAVAASFNAPIAGALFALEVIIGHYALHAFAPIVVAAIAGTLVSHAHLGNFPAFVVTDHTITSIWEFPAFFLLAILVSLVAVAFMRSLHRINRILTFREILPIWAQPIMGGCIIGLLALSHPEILGVGYEATTRAINGNYGLTLLVTLFIMKFVATVTCVGFRFGGGVFSPSLVIGSLFGGAFGVAAASLFPSYASDPGVYAIVGMGGMASAVLGAPISTILIIFEITGDYSLTVAVMIGCAVATSFASFFDTSSFFHQILHTRGVFLEGGRATYLLKSEKVADHMTRDFFTLQISAPLKKAREMLVLQGGGIVLVCGIEGAFIGTVSLDDMPADIFADSEEQSLAQFVKRECHRIVANAPLEEVLRLMEREDKDALPVISERDESVVVGLIKRNRVMKAYNAALLESTGRRD